MSKLDHSVILYIGQTEERKGLIILNLIFLKYWANNKAMKLLDLKIEKLMKKLNSKY
jgi:hypothetical protein